MLNADVAGFLDGYLQKNAQGGAAGAAAVLGLGRAGARALERYLVPILVATPALVGLGTGALHSKLTSPAKLDIGTLQKAILAAEQEQFAAEMQRRKAMEDARKKEETDKEKERTIRL